MTHTARRIPGSVGTLLAAGVAALLLVTATPARAAEPVEILFLYGSEKKAWIEKVTKTFQETQPTIANGRPIIVKAVPMGSGEISRIVISGEKVVGKDGKERQPHLISPASGAYIELGNAEAIEKKQPAMVKKTQPLVLSPVVIAMWKPMAEALGWPNKPIGWDDLRQLAENPKGWGSVGHPEWGAFKFGHTHPETSNSGLIAVLAQVHAAAYKSNPSSVKIDRQNIEAVKTAEFVRGLQKSIVHYGESTGFFATAMFNSGMKYLSAAVLYESSVVESYDKTRYNPPVPVVAIYPKEGTFWSDHPVGVVERPWVGADKREAAEKYIEYLLKEEQQKKALKEGFRPGLEKLEVTAPIDRLHGVDPADPKILGKPSVEVMKACLKSWQKNKKNVRLVLVLDRSGSMRFDDKMIKARDGCKSIIDGLGDQDIMDILTFSSDITWISKDGRKLDEKEKEKLKGLLDMVKPRGETALFDAIAQAHEHLQKTRKPDEITAIVVLTDGDDNRSTKTLDDLVKIVKFDPDNGVETRIFTIAYGGLSSTEITTDALAKIAEATKAKAKEGNPKTIDKVIDEIIKFF